MRGLLIDARKITLLKDIFNSPLTRKTLLYDDFEKNWNQSQMPKAPLKGGPDRSNDSVQKDA